LSSSKGGDFVGGVKVRDHHPNDVVILAPVRHPQQYINVEAVPFAPGSPGLLHACPGIDQRAVHVKEHGFASEQPAVRRVQYAESEHPGPFFMLLPDNRVR
jgi:hypothetical protein